MSKLKQAKIESRDELFIELIKANCRGEEDSVNVKDFYQLIQSSGMAGKWVEARDGNFLQYFVGKSDTFEVIEKEGGEIGICLRDPKTPLDNIRSPRLPVPEKLIPFSSKGNSNESQLKKRKSVRLGQLVKMWEKSWKDEEEAVMSPMSPLMPKIPNLSEKECLSCLEDKIVTRFHTFYNCGHNTLCKECCIAHVEHSIMTRRIPIPCPDSKCSKEINQYDLNWLLKDKEDLMMNYFKFSVDIAISTSKDMHQCLTPDCPFAFWSDQNDRYFHCPTCHKEWCLQCKVPWHTSMNCSEHVGKLNDDDFKRLCKNNAWKECPKCGAIVAKISGCNHMTCICKHEFCYVCLSEEYEDCDCTSDEETDTEDEDDDDEMDDDDETDDETDSDTESEEESDSDSD